MKNAGEGVKLYGRVSPGSLVVSLDKTFVGPCMSIEM